jgi:hypothetical protein
MNYECHAIPTLPGSTALFRDFLEPSPAGVAAMRRWYPTDPFSMDWAGKVATLDEAHRNRLSDALLRQTDRFNAGGAVIANIERLRNGAAAVVTGQQVG